MIPRGSGFHRGSDSKESAYRVGDLGSTPGSDRSPGEGNGSPLWYSCLENPMDGGAWWATVHGVARSRTRLSDFTFTFHFHALEKEIATHSSILAWKIPWTEEPGRLQHSSVLAWRIPGTGEPGVLPSVGSHRVGHN